MIGSRLSSPVLDVGLCSYAISQNIGWRLLLARTVENLPPAHFGREKFGECYFTHRNLVVPAQFYENPPYGEE